MGDTKLRADGGSTQYVSPRYLGFNVAVFLTVGLAYLVLFVLLVYLLPSGAGVGGRTSSIALVSSSLTFVFGLLLAPLVASITGLFTGIGTRTPTEASITGFAGSTIGSLLLFVVQLAFVLLAASGYASGGMDSVLLVGLAMILASGLAGTTTATVSNHYQ